MRFWLPPAAWAGILFALSSGPGAQVPIHVRHLDKIEHALAYAVLGALIARAIVLSRPMMFVAPRIAIAGLLATLYGVSDEIHQSFVPQRESSAGDAAADATGSFAGAALYSAWRRRSVRGRTVA